MRYVGHRREGAGCRPQGFAAQPDGRRPIHPVAGKLVGDAQCRAKRSWLLGDKVIYRWEMNDAFSQQKRRSLFQEAQRTSIIGQRLTVSGGSVSNRSDPPNDKSA